MKIVFLDVDGVICTERSCASDDSRLEVFDLVGIRLVERLLKDSGAKLVMSSSWRLDYTREGMEEILTKNGMTYFPWHDDWKTPTDPKGHRGREIQAWLDVHKTTVINYLILDDERLMLPNQKSFHVKTSWRDGISYTDYLDARSVLNI